MKRVPEILRTTSRGAVALVLMMACTGAPRQESGSGGPAVASPSPQEGIMLSDSQVRLANITTSKITKRQLGNSTLLNARLAVNQDRSVVVSSRSAGRIEKLYVRETGRILQAGEPFLELFSENLLTLQREYLLAIEQAATLGARYESFAASARKKLIRYGLTDKQIETLNRTKATQDRVRFLAPAGGMVTEILVAEGSYVEEGTPLYRVEDTRQLWVEAELYSGEMNAVRVGETVEVNVPGVTREPLAARVSFINPEFRNGQVVILRAVLDNPAMQLRPGMPAEVVIRHSERLAISVPTDAVIRSSSGAHVFVMSDKNTFARRSVVPGIEDAHRLEILSGLREGEEVVVTGAYLLHSELILKGTGTQTSHHHESTND